MYNSLLVRLKSKRKEIADREGKELFRVFSNATLEATAAARPRSRSELMMIKGWGAKKVEKYGDEILAIINDSKASGEMTLFSENGNPQTHPFSPSKAIPPKRDGALVLKNGESGDFQVEAVFSVAEFLEAANLVLGEFGAVKIRGELSGVGVRTGMAFFNLKDAEGADAMLGCFLGRWNFDRYSHLMEEGLEVIVRARPSIYKNGNFRLVVEAIEPVGEGALKKAFEALKKKLDGLGYFDESRKRPMPAFVRKIGLVTSESGAVINDFLRNIGEHGFQIYFRDVRVEGDFAEESISLAIKWFNKRMPDLDVLVVIRGGGGLENLKAFNGEVLAETILTSRLPVLTGIGHHADETIAGLVSDKNFSTPTAVAAFLRNLQEDLSAQANKYAWDLEKGAETLLERYQFRLTGLASRMEAGLSKIFQTFAYLERAFSGAIHAYETIVQGFSHSLTMGVDHLSNAADELHRIWENRLNLVAAALQPLDPGAILERGYSVVCDEKGRVIKAAQDVKRGEEIRVRVYKGRIYSRVERIEN